MLTEEKEVFQRRPLKEEIFDVLQRRIIAGKYAPGEWLRQEDIATQLGVSMTPVREALDLLVSAGLAERVPYRGVRVFQLTNEEIADAYGMRLLLETAAARAAAMHIQPEQVQALSAMVNRLHELVTLNEMSSARAISREFHTSVVALSENPLLMRMYEMVINTFPDWMLYEAMFRHPEALVTTINMEYDEHRALVEALAAGDPEVAAARAASHILSLGRELETYCGIPADLLREREKQALAGNP